MNYAEVFRIPSQSSFLNSGLVEHVSRCPSKFDCYHSSLGKKQ